MNITPRAYQLAIYNSILQNGNTLVVLPTGLGKTLIAVMLIRDKMKTGKCLFLTPTKPLARQHFESIKKILSLEETHVTIVTGELSPEKRNKEYEKPIIISTPQTIRNDFIENRINKEFSLCIFDECHRAVGDYAYVFVADKFYEKNTEEKQKTLLVGLTASPGGRSERINEVMGNLHIENIEIRTSSDEDVKTYVQQSTINWIPIDLSPTLRLIKITIDEMLAKHAQSLSNLGFPPPLRHKGKFMELRQRILDSNNNLKYAAIMQYSVLLNLLHMSELIETQGVYALSRYLEKVKVKESKSAKVLMHEQGFKKILELVNTTEEHPKLKELINLIKKLNGKKIIIFAQYRDQIKKIEDELKTNGIAAKQFIGKKDSYTRKMQEETIRAFRNNEFDVLVASSIGEEGIDIPAVDCVIFYEPIPSEIRSIQRRGRAARLKEGEIYILMTRGTRDEYFYWSAINKEKKMKKIILSMQNKLKKEKFIVGQNINNDEKILQDPGEYVTAENINAGKSVKDEKEGKKGQTKISHFI